MEHRIFACTLNAPATFRLGQPIIVKFEISNISSETYQILTWGTPLEDEVTNFLTVRRNDVVLDYDGRLIKRGDPPYNAYRVLQPGESLSNQVDISQSYPVDEEGDYTVTLNAILHDAFPIPGTRQRPERALHDHQLLALDPATTNFQVVPGGPPKTTTGQAARLAESIVDAEVKEPRPFLEGGTAIQRAETLLAHDRAKCYAALCGNLLTRDTGQSRALYGEWFGAVDRGRHDTVLLHYYEIYQVLATQSVTYNLTCSTCEPNTYAYTYKGLRTVYLCSQYMIAPQTGMNSKFGVMIHEWSHAACYTDDHVYGEMACRNLARTDPTMAVNNADNHEYLAEQLVGTTNRIYCFHEGKGDDKQLRYGVWDGYSMPKDNPVTGVRMTDSPALAVYNCKLYCLHQGKDDDGKLWHIEWDGVSWSEDIEVKGVGMTGSPALAVYRDKLYCFHQGKSKNGELRYCFWDGLTWSKDIEVKGVGMSESPALVFKDELYCFHQGWDTDGKLWYTVWDGYIWSKDYEVEKVGMSASPALAVYEGELYCFHQGKGDNGELRYIVWDGSSSSTWSDDIQVKNVGMSASPALAVYEGELYCFHQGKGDNGELRYVVWNGSKWSGDLDIKAVGLSGSPALTVSAAFLPL